MSARDVVLLHGWGYSAAVWDGLAKRLEPLFRVSAPHLPGFGGSPPCSPYTLEALARAVARSAPRRCHVVGWSLGGEIALAWARRAPDQVQRLALIATTPCFIAKPGWACGTPREVVREFGRSLAADRAVTMARFIGAQSRGDSRRRQVEAALRRAADARAPGSVLAAGLDVLLEADLRGALHRITQPALVVHGARDGTVPSAAGRRLAGLLPDARFALMPSCAHAPFLSHPRRVARALREFFA